MPAPERTRGKSLIFWVFAPLLLMAGNMALAGNRAELEQLYGELLHRYWRPAVKIHGIETTVLDYAAMKKDSRLFSEGKGGVLGFVSSYVGKDLRQWLTTSAIEIRYFDHDWALNDIALADRSASEGGR